MVALNVSRRTREIGVRAALGADTARVVSDVLRGALLPVLAGALAGTCGALIAMGWLEGVLYRVPARDPLSIAAAVSLLLATAVAACSIPARRASRIDPMVALRSD